MFQETFDAGLQAFQQEGIANITALKDQLLAAKHIQSKAIEARHASLMKRWSQLLANSATRKKKLLEAQSHFRKVSVGPAELSWPSPQEGQIRLPSAMLCHHLCTVAWSQLKPWQAVSRGCQSDAQDTLNLQIPREKGSKGRETEGSRE